MMQHNDKAVRDNRRQKGRIGEDVAAYYLQQQGYHILERNWRCRSGELDIIAVAPSESARQYAAHDWIVENDAAYNASIDIISEQADHFQTMLLHKHLAFVNQSAIIVITEVRSRTGDTHGTAAESVDWRKRKQLRETAAFYAHHTGLHEVAFRYDVIAVRLNEHDQAVELEHCIEAFT
ncbi:YraN family protein [Paenibacillus campi]|uniref:YraN family protein n=1 Tax=Paenibacillus campi TaxID=3106031 RepID=UPI002AFEB6E3|nr:YraN family protein [Paenibacillus sp. SGZ-1009]